MSVSKSTLSPGLVARLKEAWQGEVFGKAMYAAVARSQTDPFRRWQWQVLHQLEVETGDAIRQLLLRHGCNANEDDASIRAGEAEAARTSGLPWHEMMESFESDLPDIIKEYEELERDCAFTGEDAAALRLLVDHEVVSLAFARTEMSGDSASSLAPVLSLLKTVPARPA